MPAAVPAAQPVRNSGRSVSSFGREEREPRERRNSSARDSGAKAPWAAERTAKTSTHGDFAEPPQGDSSLCSWSPPRHQQRRCWSRRSPRSRASGHACSVGTLNNGTTNDGTNEGVFCADVSNSTNGSTVIVNMGAEGICQNAFSSTGPNQSNAPMSTSPSPCGRKAKNSRSRDDGVRPQRHRVLSNARYRLSLTLIQVPLTSLRAGLDRGGRGIDDRATQEGEPELPLGANLGSGHITICP